MAGLANMTMAPHHSSAVFVKRNLPLASFKPTRYLSAAEFGALAQDYITFGTCYLERQQSMANTLLRCKRSPVLCTRRGLEDGQFGFLPRESHEHAFDPGTLVQLRDEDVRQEICGVGIFECAARGTTQPFGHTVPPQV